jgi:hypothetical protein
MRWILAAVSLRPPEPLLSRPAKMVPSAAMSISMGSVTVAWVNVAA